MAYGEEGNLPLNEGCVGTIKTIGAVNGGCAVTFAGAQVAAQGADTVYGIAETDAAINTYLAVRTAGEGQGVSAVAIAVGAKVTTSANGRWETAASGDFVFGRAMMAATAADQKFKILITREGILA
jgi:hypothetical protein